MKEKWGFYFIIIMCGLFILSLIICGTTSAVTKVSHDNFCYENYPAKTDEPFFENVWSKRAPLEPGYIKCCRYNYVNHERINECEILEYDKEDD